MCPVCIAAVAQWVAGATSTGGLTAVIVNTFRATGHAGANHPTVDITGGDDESSTRRIEN
jgi:hypothetical protein